MFPGDGLSQQCYEIMTIIYMTGGNCYRDTHHRLAIQCSQANELYNLLGINLIQPSTLLPPLHPAPQAEAGFNKN